MPDVREVYEMLTKHTPPEPGALERQRRRQIRAVRNRKLGALAVAAAIGLAALIVVLATRTGGTGPTPVGDPTTAPISPPPTVNPADTASEEVVSGFLRAYAAFDAAGAMRYVADEAELTGLIEQVPADAEGLSLWLSFLEAQRFEHTITSCDPNTIGTDTVVICAYDFSLIRSQALGRGPFSGSEYTFTVRDGEIVRAALFWDVEEFSPQMWEPFAGWVAAEHPKDVEVMYLDDSQVNFRLTEKSIRLWEQRSKEYVEAVRRGNAE